MADVTTIPAPEDVDFSNTEGDSLARLYAAVHGQVPQSAAGANARELTLRLFRLINYYRSQCAVKPVNTPCGATRLPDPQDLDAVAHWMAGESFLVIIHRPQHQKPSVYHDSWHAASSHIINFVVDYGDPLQINAVLRDGFATLDNWSIGDDGLPLMYTTTIGGVPLTVLRIQ